MAGTLTTQILEDGPRNSIVKVTYISNTTTGDLAQQVVIDPASFSPVPTQFRIDGIWFSISDQLEVQLLWDATTPVLIVPLAGRGKQFYKQFGGLQNNAGAGKNGKIDMLTTGWASGTQIFEIILWLVKSGT